MRHHHTQLALHEIKITLVRLYQVLTFDVDSEYHNKGLRTVQTISIQPADGVHCHVRARPPLKK